MNMIIPYEGGSRSMPKQQTLSSMYVYRACGSPENGKAVRAHSASLPAFLSQIK